MPLMTTTICMAIAHCRKVFQLHVVIVSICWLGLTRKGCIIYIPIYLFAIGGNGVKRALDRRKILQKARSLSCCSAQSILYWLPAFSWRLFSTAIVWSFILTAWHWKSDTTNVEYYLPVFLTKIAFSAKYTVFKETVRGWMSGGNVAVFSSLAAKKKRKKA